MQSKFEKIITIYPVILDEFHRPISLSSRISWVRMRAISRLRKSLSAMLANTANTLLSKHSWHKDCFNSVNPKAINYNFNVLTLMPIVTSEMAVQRHTALFIFSSQGVAQ